MATALGHPDTAVQPGQPPGRKSGRRRYGCPTPGPGSSRGAFAPGENGGLWETTIAVNLGGAIIPLALSVYLLYRALPVMSGNLLWLQVPVAVLIVAAIAYATTLPMIGVGIRAPLFIPGLTALLCGILLAGGPGLSAGVIAFVSGTIGTLLGANIAHLPHVGDLEVPQVSIGGAGTFGAIFVACILSALIA